MGSHACNPNIVGTEMEGPESSAVSPTSRSVTLLVQ